MRPATAGKGLWRVRISQAPRKSRAWARPIHSAMSPFTGQAAWHGEGACMCCGNAARHVPVLNTSVVPVVQMLGTASFAVMPLPPLGPAIGGDLAVGVRRRFAFGSDPLV